MHACMNGHEKIAAYLLQMNAIIDIKDKDGKSHGQNLASTVLHVPYLLDSGRR